MLVTIASIWIVFRDPKLPTTMQTRPLEYHGLHVLQSLVSFSIRNAGFPRSAREHSRTRKCAGAGGSAGIRRTYGPENLPEPPLEKAGSSKVGGYHEADADAKRRLITKAIQENGGNYTHAVKVLGLQPTYLHRLMRNLNLKTESIHQR
jgi:transcriptional regulator with GAF, ATPase, and Fis domain